MNPTDLKTKLKTLPPKPGVYIFKDEASHIIYIGKALSLKHRVKSYFAKNLADPKTKLLVGRIWDLEYLTVPSEFEALLLEAQLIKEHRPKYNIRLKDNTSYLYIAITKAPYRIFPLRQPELGTDLLDWYGPFPSSSDVRMVLRTIRGVFPFCSDRRVPAHRCLYKDLDLCPGHEQLFSSEYHQTIRQIQRVLSGQTSLLVKNLEKQMKQAASQLNFEQAQKYKNRLEAMVYITQSWKNVPAEELADHQVMIKLRKLLVRYQGLDPMAIRRIEGYDVSNLGKSIIVGSMVVFNPTQPDKSQYRKFKINLRVPRPEGRFRLENQNDPDSINQLIKRRLNHKEWLYPQLILVDGGKPQVSAALQALRQKS